MRVYVVGGALRADLLGLKSVDRDYVVIGSTPEEMIALKYVPVGKDFPVFLHPITKEEYALARTEKKSGQGYKGFTFYTSPDVTLEEDLIRRDFTMNAIAREVNSNGEWIGALIDPYEGQKDIQRKLIRHLSPAFSEDPLRILRLARFATKLTDFEVADETYILAKKMVKEGELDHLVAERISQEILRGLMGAKPSRMLDVFEKIDALKVIFPKDFLETEILKITKSELDLAANANLELFSRCAILMNKVGNQVAENWFERLKISEELKAFSLLYKNWCVVSQTKDLRNASLYLEFLNQADAWRKPLRLNEIFSLAKFFHHDMTVWEKVFEVSRNVSAGEIAKNMTHAEGSAIGRAVKLARLKAIEACL